MSPDYWEDNLTMRRRAAHLEELRQHPPPDFFLGAYFEAQGWWTPPHRDPEIPLSAPIIAAEQLPEFEE